MLSFVLATPIIHHRYSHPNIHLPYPSHPHYRHRYRPPCPHHSHSQFLTITTSSLETTKPPPPLIIGINQYSHDASIAVINAQTGKILYALSKERLTRHKHDGGDISILLPHALRSISNDLHLKSTTKLEENIKLIIHNNHHFRIKPFESRLKFQVSLGYVPKSYICKWNLLSKYNKIEVSHHLAHAYSAIMDSDLQFGLVIVMDGMGDSLNQWLKYENENDYITEISKNRHHLVDDHEQFKQFPKDLYDRVKQGVCFREAETVYEFDKSFGNIKLERVFKRWTAENLPSELTNHSFEEMDSVGAVYSRISAIIFNDWNNCGKVMGLAPFGKIEENNKNTKQERTFMHGELIDGSIDMSKGREIGEEYIENNFKDTKGNPDLLNHYERISYSVQWDLESIVLNFIQSLIQQTGLKNVVFTGGVAQNSCVNGCISELENVDKFHVPAFPGDEGIAIGCAMIGLSILQRQENYKVHHEKFGMPFWGKLYDLNEIKKSIGIYDKWIEGIELSIDEVINEGAKVINNDCGVIGWFYGRSEYGPRALGHRSLLADSTRKQSKQFMNSAVKNREQFRPLAPAIIEEDAMKIFEHIDNDNSSSYQVMGMTKQFKNLNGIETNAVIHVDGSARLQIVRMGQGNDLFHKFIEKVKRSSGIGMVMNTSFNIAGEPMVESPLHAIRAFVKNQGISVLIFADVGIVVKRKQLITFHGDMLLKCACRTFESSVTENSNGECVRVQLKFQRTICEEEEEEEEEAEWERLDLHDGLELEILDIIHGRGSVLVSDIMLCVCDGGGDEEIGGKPSEEDVHERIESLYERMLIYTDSH